MREDWERHLLHEYNRALEGTGGVLVNKRGRALKIDGLDLFTGPLARAQKYASEELLEYWRVNGRMTMAHYERIWLDGQTPGHAA